MQACGFDTNKALERASGIDNTSISRWKNGESVPSLEHLRKLVGPLQTPLLQLMVRAGLLSPEEAKVTRLAAVPDPPKLDVVAAIRQDPELLPETKEHIERQYGLLLRVDRAAAAADTNGQDLLDLPHVARKRTPPSKRPR